MSKVAIGIKWQTGSKVIPQAEVVVIGRGDRTHADAVRSRVPSRLRDEVTEWLKPIAEGMGPRQFGEYKRLSDGSYLIMWYKLVSEILP